MRTFDDSAKEGYSWVVGHWRLLAMGGLAGALVGFGLSLVLPRTYSATTRFTVNTDRNELSANRLASFAAQLHIAPALGPQDSPDYFAALETSRDVGVSMLRDTVCLRQRPCGTVAETIFDGLPAAADRSGWERLFAKLAKQLQVGVDAKTGIIGVTAKASSPERAEALLRAHLRALSKAIVQGRETQAHQERVFAQERLTLLEQQRRAVVDTLTAFYQGNRSLGESPSLKFRERELNDRLAIWQDLVQSVAKEGELARLDEARDVPVIAMVEQPYASPKKVSPKGSLLGALGVFVGVLLAASTQRRATSRSSATNDVAVPPRRSHRLQA